MTVTTSGSGKDMEVWIHGKAFYPCIFFRGKYKGKETDYNMKLGGLTEEDEAACEALGMVVHDAEAKKSTKGKGMGKYIITSQGNFKPTVIDSAKNPITSPLKVGNGSRVVVQGRLRQPAGNDFNKLYFSVVQIVELLEYVPEANLDGFAEVKDGYVAPSSADDDVKAASESNLDGFEE
jgi:hypothetical protein